jgi:hypothetical protein
VTRAFQSAKRARSGEPMTFTLDGVKFTCSTEISVLDFSEIASYADLDASSPEGMAVLHSFFTIVLGPAEYRRFRRHCAQHRTDDDTIVDVLGALLEEYLGRPTQAPLSSSGSPSATGTGSAAPGSHVVVNLGTGSLRETTEPPAPVLPDLSQLGDVERVS